MTRPAAGDRRPDRGMVSERWAVLVGGSGSVGRHLASWLAQDGWRVRVASRHPPRDMAATARIVAVRADLRDED
jgi:uncharacterized protein YbjT (DUF2867 family)